MSILSKVFMSIFYLLSLVLPFAFCLFSLFIILVLLYRADMISSFSLILTSFLSSHTLLSVFLLYLGIILGFFFPDISKYLKIMIYGSIIYLAFSLFLTEISIISSIGLKINQNTCASTINFIQSWFCLMFGYFPTTNSLNETLIGFSILLFGIIFPLFILYKLISNAIKDSGMITNDYYRFFISLSLAFMAFRGLLLSRLLNALSMGLGGLLVVILNFVVLKYAIDKVHKISLKFSKMEQKELKERSSAQLKGILRTKLSEIKSLESSHQIKTAFDGIRSDLESYFSTINKSSTFKSILTDFTLSAEQGDKNGMRRAIDRMIAEID
jgi:hypothetical protein